MQIRVFFELYSEGHSSSKPPAKKPLSAPNLRMRGQGTSNSNHIGSLCKFHSGSDVGSVLGLGRPQKNQRARPIMPCSLLSNTEGAHGPLPWVVARCGVAIVHASVRTMPSRKDVEFNRVAGMVTTYTPTPALSETPNQWRRQHVIFILFRQHPKGFLVQNA